MLFCISVTDVDTISDGIGYNFSNGLAVYGSPSIFEVNNTGCVILIGGLDKETKDSYEVLFSIEEFNY